MNLYHSGEVAYSQLIMIGGNAPLSFHNGFFENYNGVIREVTLL